MFLDHSLIAPIQFGHSTRMLTVLNFIERLIKQCLYGLSPHDSSLVRGRDMRRKECVGHRFISHPNVLLSMGYTIYIYNVDVEPVNDSESNNENGLPNSRFCVGIAI